VSVKVALPVPNPVVTTMGVAAIPSVSRTRRTKCAPSAPGMETSVMIKSGRRLRASSYAFNPSSAVNTSKPCRSKVMHNNCRATSSSSATRIFFRSLIVRKSTKAVNRES
jgi:hypothetical protein